MYGLIAATAALAAIANAAPAPLPAADSAAALLANSFSLLMQVYPHNQTVTAVYNNDINATVLVGSSDPSAVGVPAFTNSTDAKPGYTALNILFEEEVQHLFIGNVGEVYGLHELVNVDPEYPDPEWQVVDGYVYHQLWAASNLFLACNETVNGETELVLSFGVVTDGGNVPDGCIATTVYQNCNIPGSSAVC